MRVLITGAGGMLGQAAAREFQAHNHTVTALNHGELDITDLKAVSRALAQHAPEVIINCAAYTRVDQAEIEYDAAVKVNALGVRNLALACKERDIILAHISTDYVFGGEQEVNVGGTPGCGNGGAIFIGGPVGSRETACVPLGGNTRGAGSIPTEDAPSGPRVAGATAAPPDQATLPSGPLPAGPVVVDSQPGEPWGIFAARHPINAYGRSKYLGERFLETIAPRYYLVRTSWLFGPGGPNFVETILKLAREKETLTVVDDQWGCPTYTVDLASALVCLVESGCYGVYHITNQGATTWYHFAREILAAAGVNVNIKPVTTVEFPRPARRPVYSVLDPFPLKETIGYLLPALQDALKRYLAGKAALEKDAI